MVILCYNGANFIMEAAMIRFLLGLILISSSIEVFAQNEDAVTIYNMETLKDCSENSSDEIAGLEFSEGVRTIVCLEGVDGKYHWVLFSKKRLAYVNKLQFMDKAKSLMGEFEKQLKNLDPEALQRIWTEPQNKKSVDSNDVKYET